MSNENKNLNEIEQLESTKQLEQLETSVDINVDIDSEIVRNSGLDPEASEYLPIKTTNNETNENLEDYKSGNNNEWLEKAIIFELEYNFGDISLSMDNYLLSRMHENKDYWVPFETVANLTKIRQYTTDEDLIKRCIKKSNLIFNEDFTKVKRPNFIPPKPKQHKDLRRTVFIYGLTPNITKKDIINICSQYGKIKKIVLDNPNENNAIKIDNNNNNIIEENKTKTIVKTVDKRNSILVDTQPPDREVAQILMQKKFGIRIVPVINNINNNSSNNNNINNNNNNINNINNISIDTNIDTNNNNNNISMGISHPSFSHPIKNPNGDMNDFSHLRTAFVVFESQGQANKCVKDRLRSLDGIRCMHQYDFNKAKKKVASAKARGLSPMFSPLVDSVPNNLSGSFALQSGVFNFNSPNICNRSIHNRGWSDGAIQLTPSIYSHSTRNINSQLSQDNNNNNIKHRRYKSDSYFSQKYPQSARNTNYNNNNNTRFGGNSRYNNQHRRTQSNSNYRNIYNRTSNHNRRASEGQLPSRWEFTRNSRSRTNSDNSNRSNTPKSNKNVRKTSFDARTAKGPENHKGFGWSRNSQHKQYQKLPVKGTIPPYSSPKDPIFLSYRTNNESKQEYVYQVKSNTPNSLTATIHAPKNNQTSSSIGCKIPSMPSMPSSTSMISHN